MAQILESLYGGATWLLDNANKLDRDNMRHSAVEVAHRMFRIETKCLVKLLDLHFEFLLDEKGIATVDRGFPRLGSELDRGRRRKASSSAPGQG